MKLVINNCYGGFGVNCDIAEKFGFDPYGVERDNIRLITLIELGVDCNNWASDLRVVEIPDAATDYEITEYDGRESVIYVLDGKIRHLEI